MNKEVIGYYQSNIKTSRNEDSVYAMKYASQQMLINELQQENEKLKHYKKLYQILKREKEELRSWLEEWKETLETDFSRDEFEDGNLVAIEDVLSKLNELEEGKNE